MPMPDAGTPAPPFAMPDQDGNEVRLADLRGKWVVLYFYPRNDTPGCTKEACNFRDNPAALQKAGAVVLGVSPDTAASHQKFISKYELPFRLLVDDKEHSVARAYGAWGMKKNYGKEYEGMIRATAVIDPNGTLAKTWPRVKPDAHGAEVLAYLQSQQP